MFPDASSIAEELVDVFVSLSGSPLLLLSCILSKQKKGEGLVLNIECSMNKYSDLANSQNGANFE
jgi:hypothetical protein